MRSFIISLFDFIIPRECPSCGKKLFTEESVICNACYGSIKSAAPGRLKFEFKRKLSHEGVISGIFCPFVFEKDKALQHLIHSLKYGKRYQNGFFLGKLTGDTGKNIFREWNIDIIIPVPLHSLRKAERGYNQSEYIAKGISRITSLPYTCRALKRKRITATQTKMNIVERKQNIFDAFSVKNKKLIQGKNVLLVDDVLTTGSTVSECGRTLLKAGAAKIYAAASAIAD